MYIFNLQLLQHDIKKHNNEDKFLLHSKDFPGYKKYLEIKKVQICKSCGKKSLKGCCSGYNASNRSVLTMVIGWSKK